jgi:Septum formation
MGAELAMSVLPPPPSRYQPQPVAYEAPRNGLGIAALILGVIGVLSGFVRFYWVAGVLGIIGLILGFIGYGRFQRSEATNGTTALWGIIISAVAVVFSFVGVVFLTGGSADPSDEPSVATGDTASSAGETSAPAQAEETAPTESEEVNVYDLEVGDCVAAVTDGSTVQTVPCSEPHSEEVFAAVSLPGGDGDFPGYAAIDARAEELCTAEFEGFVGLPYEDSMLHMYFVIPSEELWDAGDQVVLCTIYDPDGDTTGTLADANR